MFIQVDLHEGKKLYLSEQSRKVIELNMFVLI